MPDLRLVLVGPPGVGKGTQAALMVERYGLTHLATGDMFRDEAARGTDLGLTVKNYMDRGELVPDEVTIHMMRSRLAGKSSFLFDGFPRTVAQAEALDAMLADLGLSLEKAISLEVDDEVVVERLGGRLVCPIDGSTYHRKFGPPQAEGRCDRCGAELIVRKDDNPETIRERLRVFRESTRPVLDYYESQGKVARVPSAGSPDEVFAAIIEALGA